MSRPLVVIEHDGPITTIGINRSEARNAVDGPTAAALESAFTQFDADDTASVAILHGVGGTFCAGADLKALGTDQGNRASADGPGPMGPTRMQLTKPVIAAIDGFAVAGGLELAIWADLRVVEDTAVLGVFCRRWGVPLIDGGTVRLPRLIGTSRAMDLTLTGRPVSGQEAFDIGLANRLVPHGTALERAHELAREIAAFPQTCMRNDRLSLLEQDGLDEGHALTNEWRHGLVSLATDTIEGAARFVNGAGRHGVRLEPQQATKDSQ